MVFRATDSYASLISGGDNKIHDNYWDGNDANHDGTAVDPNQFGACLPTACGPNTVSNNHLTANLSQVPAEILTAAGPVVQKLLPTGVIFAGTQNVSWQTTPGASGYLLRIDDLADAWTCSSQQPNDICTGTLSNNYFPYNFQSAHNYKIWVHPIFTITNTYGVPEISLINVRSHYNPGDLDSNGKVDIYDFALVVQNFNKSEINCTVNWNIADIVPNCKVDIYDFALVVQNFGRTQ